MRLLKNVLEMISLFLLSGVVAMKSPSQTLFFVWFTTNEAICTHACTPVFIKIKEMGKQ